MEEEESLPRLADLAHASCPRDVWSRTEEELLDLLDQPRADHANVCAIRQARRDGLARWAAGWAKPLQSSQLAALERQVGERLVGNRALPEEERGEGAVLFGVLRRGDGAGGPGGGGRDDVVRPVNRLPGRHLLEWSEWGQGRFHPSERS